MSNCQRCESDRILNLMAKCSDLCSVEIKGAKDHGYVPGGLGIGGDDYVEFRLCLDCGQVQGEFPRPLHEDLEDDDDEEVDSW